MFRTLKIILLVTVFFPVDSISQNAEMQSLIYNPAPTIVPNEKSIYWKRKILRDIKKGKKISLYMDPETGRVDTTRYIRDNKKEEMDKFQLMEDDLNSKLSEFFARILDEEYHGEENREHVEKLSDEIEGMFDIIENNGGKYVPLMEKDPEMLDRKFMAKYGQDFEIQKNMYQQKEQEYRDAVEAEFKNNNN